MTRSIGIDLGGTNFRVAAFADLEDLARASHAGKFAAPPTPVVVHKEPVGEPRDPDTIIERVAAQVERISVAAGAGPGAISVGVGLAAMLRDRRGTVANSPHLRWRDVPFGARLAARLGPRYRVGVYNDVNAITYGEYGLGAGGGAADLLAVYVGTGIGGGLVVDGRLAEGATNCAAEIGHVKVRWDDDAAPCACGGRGCVEAYVGGSYVLRRIRAELATARSQALTLAGKLDDVTPTHVDLAAADGDPWALGLWSELAPLLAVALGNAITLVNPSRLVLGGGLLSRTPVLRELALTTMQVIVPAALLEPLTIVDGALGDDAGIIGAALLASRGVSVV